MTQANETTPLTRVLAIQPSVDGVAYAVMESKEDLVAWGVRRMVVATAEKNPLGLKFVERLMVLYEPDVVVLENYKAKGQRRYPRVQELIESITKLASSRNIKTQRFSRAEVRKAFAKYHV